MEGDKRMGRTNAIRAQCIKYGRYTISFASILFFFAFVVIVIIVNFGSGGGDGDFDGMVVVATLCAECYWHTRQYLLGLI